MSLNSNFQADKAQIVEVIRLDGNSPDEFAVPFEDFAGGMSGRVYEMKGPFKSMTCAWLRETEQDAEFEVNDIGYRAGAVNGSAGYVTVLPQLDNNGGIEAHFGKYKFIAGAGAYIEIIITR